MDRFAEVILGLDMLPDKGLMRHSANLDLLRSFAVSAVILDHLLHTWAHFSCLETEGLTTFCDSVGQVGVLAFFVHTSLVLMYSLERLSISSSNVTLRFYVRRFFRIYPLSVFCIILALVLHIPDTTWRIPIIVTRGMIVSNFMLVQNLFGDGSIQGPLWSLPFEVQMYLALPLLYLLTVRKRAPIYLGAVFAFFCCLSVLFYTWTGNHLKIADYVPCFICGVLCYSLRNRIPACVPAVVWPPLVILAMAGYCIVGERHLVRTSPAGWLFCLFLCFAINAFHDSQYKSVNLIAANIARYSYGVYLLHTAVLYFVVIVFGLKSVITGSLVFLAITAVVSVIAYHVIELPFIEIGKKLSPGNLGPSTVRAQLGRQFRVGGK